LIVFSDTLANFLGYTANLTTPARFPAAAPARAHGRMIEMNHTNCGSATTIGATRLAGPDFMIEIEAIAVVNS